MAKTKVDEWDTVPANNADIDGISILGTAPASNMDNALRELMAQIRATPLREDAADMVTALGIIPTTDASLLTTGTLDDARLSFTVSAFAKTLLDDADAVDTRTTLGAQASDATLTSLSGLSLAAGDVLYATAADTLARLPKGTAAQVLAMNAGATAPEWSTSTAQASDATLTSLSGLSLAAGDVLYATAADTLARLPKGTAAQVLAMNAGATAPEWSTSTGQTNESLAHDAIGQYCFAATSATNTAITPGSTYAGSGLRAAGYNAIDSATQPRMEKSATALTGTWRALGYAPAAASHYSVAMFVRIS